MSSLIYHTEVRCLFHRHNPLSAVRDTSGRGLDTNHKHDQPDTDFHLHLFLRDLFV